MYHYVIVKFLNKSYTKKAALHIHPKPDQLIRVFANFKFSVDPVTCGEPPLKPVKRLTKDKVVVEWGGTESVPDTMASKSITVNAELLHS